MKPVGTVVHLTLLPKGKLRSFNRDEDNEFLLFLKEVPQLLGGDHSKKRIIEASELTEKLGIEKEFVKLRLRNL